MRGAFQWLLTIRSQDEDIRRRGYTVALLALGLMAMALLLMFTPLQQGQTSGIFILSGGFFGLLGALLLARSGRVAMGSAIIMAVIMVSVLSSIYTNRAVTFSVFFLALALIVAGQTLRPGQVWLVLAVDLAGLAAVLAQLPRETILGGRNLLIGGIIFQLIVAVMGFLGARSAAVSMHQLQQSRTLAEASASELAHSNSRLEQQVAARTFELSTALEQLRRQVDEQARLLTENEQQRTTIREMSVPIIPVSETAVVIPLVGALDTARLGELQSQALRAIEQTGVCTLVLDITGVVVVDSQVALGIVGVVNAARMLGADVLLVGIRPEVAQAIVQLGLPFGGMRTFSTLRAALRQHVARAA